MTSPAGAPTRDVVLASLPGLLLATLLLGPGVLTNLAAIMVVAYALRTMLRASDNHEARTSLPWVGAIVLALALPPACPVWLPALCALLLCGAHGSIATPRLPFNAAMVAAAFAFIALPGALSTWPAQPVGVDDWGNQLRQAMSVERSQPVAAEASPAAATVAQTIDGSTGATALVAMAQRAPLTISEVRAEDPAFGSIGGAGYEWLAVAWLAGGLWLLQRRVIGWHTTAGFTVGMLLAATLLYDGDGAFGGAPPLLNLFAGGTLLVAFFVLTEPGSSPHTNAGRMLYGLSAGVLLCCLRESAGGADRAAVVVLLVNALAPAFDTLAARLRRPAPAAIA